MRHHRRAALGLVMLLASCSRASSQRAYGLPPDMFRVDSDRSWFAERAALLAELSRREAQWAAQRPPAYQFRSTWANFGILFTGDVIAAPGRPLVICNMNTVGAPADSVAREDIAVDVPALFKEIRTALTDTTRAVYVQFDPVQGFPMYLEIQNRWVSEAGYIRRAERFRAIPEDQAHCARNNADAVDRRRGFRLTSNAGAGWSRR